MKLSDFIDINPRTKVAKGSSAEFVPMEAIDPTRRYVRTYPKKNYSGGAKFLSGDTLFARITPCLENGKIAQFVSELKDPAFGSTEYWVFRAKEEVSDPGFVYYLAKSDFIRKPAEKSMVGASGRQRAQIESVQNIQIPEISLNQQQKISGILGAYDDLIDLNHRRIAILENMASSLFRKYFAVGKDGRVKSFGEIADVTYGYAFKSSRFNTQEIGKPLVRIRDILNGHTNTYSDEDPGEKYVVKNGDILIGMDGEFHMNIWGGGDALLVQRVALVRPKDNIPTLVLFNYLKPKIEYLNKVISGTTVAHLGDGHIKKISIGVPAENSFQQYSPFFTQTLQHILNLKTSIIKLQESRDMLLPRLMSGEIKV